MKKMFYQYIWPFASIAFGVCCVCFSSTGCASTEKNTNPPVVSQTNAKLVTNEFEYSAYEKRLINAKRRERRLMYQLDHATSTDEIIRCKDELNKIRSEIADMKQNKDAMAAPEKEGFKSVKDRNYTYGPLGAVLKLTQWILEKLYLIDRS
jgi:septal ring factor EnvC (AmiA/AmiB activator)